jgi:expansin (peptidoglycan-binding protein)
MVLRVSPRVLGPVDDADFRRVGPRGAGREPMKWRPSCGAADCSYTMEAADGRISWIAAMIVIPDDPFPVCFLQIMIETNAVLAESERTSFANVGEGRSKQ